MNIDMTLSKKLSPANKKRIQNSYKKFYHSDLIDSMNETDICVTCKSIFVMDFKEYDYTLYQIREMNRGYILHY
jgi:hypothetical protein